MINQNNFGNELMMLAKNVLYRKYAGYLYVINIDTLKSYVFDGIASDLMDIVSSCHEITLKEIFARIEEEYEVGNSEQMRNEIQEFVELLEVEGILERR